MIASADGLIYTAGVDKGHRVITYVAQMILLHSNQPVRVIQDL